MARQSTNDSAAHAVGFGGIYNRPAQRTDYREPGQGGHSQHTARTNGISKKPHGSAMVLKCTTCLDNIRHELQREIDNDS
mmetsp:Transcript_6276/g.11185  ORF Transcript_6276/g.11185 Transcript_6276/m.11185 type:complete len:80 (-) Transcript_6276:263-502(-)|eukprot:CAMPEP_0183747314 /NCGR_PEP_ID=MMETSP0737-20130205/67198_1 /TAXON_ID=385413 /ORGANISM="Thalassiosira miniscula, Strain CCMP1093" /LENGTH=79 /DNA_ID=CAMNT_0025983023 /DNA_START=107 /DNA_END=346 /DNA_ORIENTATION=+